MSLQKNLEFIKRYCQQSDIDFIEKHYPGLFSFEYTYRERPEIKEEYYFRVPPKIFVLLRLNFSLNFTDMGLPLEMSFCDHYPDYYLKYLFEHDEGLYHTYIAEQRLIVTPGIPWPYLIIPKQWGIESLTELLERIDLKMGTSFKEYYSKSSS